MKGNETSSKGIRSFSWVKKSLVPYVLGRGCCAREFNLIYNHCKYDLSGMGLDAVALTPEDADLLVVTGNITRENLTVVKDTFSKMRAPKWIMVLGSSAISGGVLADNEVTVDWRKYQPDAILLPGCPPGPEQIIGAIKQLQLLVGGEL